MSSIGKTAAGSATIRETANDRFKKGFGSWLWGSMVIATVVHFLMFAFWPELEAEGAYGRVTEEFEMIEMPPEVVIPPPPEAIARPATPVVSVADIPDDITIAPTTFESNPVENLPPPPPAASGDALSDFVAFAPSMVRPEFRNRGAIQDALLRHYPAHLRDAGIGGTVHVNFWIDETGRVVKYEVAQSSGFDAFDQAAGKVADIMQFSPAQNRNQAVRVVVTFPITFRVN
jgi:TonB family protein